MSKTPTINDLFGDPPPATKTPAADPISSPLTILDPTTGELVDRHDIDGLIDAYERIISHNSRLLLAMQDIRRALGELTEGDTKTRRVQGERRIAVVEFPSDTWNQAKLREIWERYPDLREQCMKIGTLSVTAREYKKLQGTSGSPALTAFRDNLAAAVQPASSPPTIKIEK